MNTFLFIYTQIIRQFETDYPNVEIKEEADRRILHDNKDFKGAEELADRIFYNNDGKNIDDLVDEIFEYLKTREGE